MVYLLSVITWENRVNAFSVEFEGDGGGESRRMGGLAGGGAVGGVKKVKLVE